MNWKWKCAMAQAHKNPKAGNFWRIASGIVLALVLITGSPKQARAQVCCGGAAIAAMAVDVDTAIGLAVTDFEAWMIAVWAPLTVLNPLYGLPAIDIDINDGFGSVVEAINEHATESAPMGAQVGADSQKYYGGVKAVSDEAHKSLVSENSTHCATTEVVNALTAAEGFSRSSTRLVTNMVRDRNVGTDQNNNPLGPSPVSAAMDVCDSAPFRANSPRNGPNIAGQLAACNNAGAAPAQFVDADLDYGSVFDVLQFEIPAQMNKT